jgi:MFS family permease
MPKPATRNIAESLAARLPFFYGWVVLGCAMSAAFARTGGAVAVLTVFVTPMSEALGWSRLAFSGAVSLGGVLAALSAPTIGVLTDRYGSGRILWVSAVILGVAALLLSQIGSLFWFYAVYCIARMTFASPFDIGITTAVSKWFVARRAQAMSSIAVTQQLGLAIMPLIAYAAMGGADWRAGWIVIGIVVLAVGVLPSMLLLVRQPEDIGLTPDPERIKKPGETVPPAALREPEFTRAQALRTPALWLIMGFSAFIYPVQAGISLHQVPQLLERGMPPWVAVSAVATFSLVAALSSLGFGMFAGRFGSRYALCIAALSLSASALAFIAVQHPWQAYLAATLFGIGIGGLQTLLPVIWGEYYGRRNFGAIRGMTLPVQVIAQAAGPLLAGAAFDWRGNYEYSMMLFAGFGVIAAILVCFARPPAWRP